MQASRHTVTGVEILLLKIPHPSKAARKISGSSPKNYRGSTIDHARNVELSFESLLELAALLIWLASGRTANILEQPPAIEYYDDDGVLHHHFFDFLAVMNDGLRVLVDVKPAALVASSGILKVQQKIREQHGKKVADRILLRTEEHMHRDDVADAKLILRATRMECAEADEAVSRLVSNTSGWLLISEIVEATGLTFKAFNSILRLVRAGVLEPLGDRRLGYDAYVRLSHNPR